MVNYITTDPDSDYALEKGKRYFMDFDVTQMPDKVKLSTTLESIGVRLKSSLRERGHEVKNVKASLPYSPDVEFGWMTLPGPTIVRVHFTVDNPIHIVVLVGIAVAIIAVAITATVYVGSSVYVLFLGLAEALKDLVNIPVTVVDQAMKNPIAIIAILVAIGIFVIGRKF